MPEASNRPTLSWRIDGLMALGLVLLSFVLIAIGIGTPGVTWDEAHPNIPAAQSQAEWLRGLFSIDAPFSQETIDAYWFTTSDHPSLPRTLAALSQLLFTHALGWLDELAALRLSSVVQFSLLTGLLFVFLRAYLSRLGALAGALSLLLMPRVFGHAHLFSLDVPIMVWWFTAAVAGHAVLRGWIAPIFFGLAYAIAFTTKLHAVFLPFPLLAWALLFVWQENENRADLLRRLAWAVGWAAVLTPIIYIGLQPWLWHDTVARIIERFFEYAEKSEARPIPLYYLGTQFRGDTPWHYPLVMLGLTLPTGILAFWLAGLSSPAWGPRMGPTSNLHLNTAGLPYLFLLLHMSVPLILVLLPLAQAYDGCRLFLPCFPFVAGLAGFGFEAASCALRRWAKPILVLPALLLIVILPSAISLPRLHPHYLAYYNQLAGGVNGARQLGMETTYWCDSLTRSFLAEINATVPPGSSLRPLSMPIEVMAYYQERGWLRNDIDLFAEPPYDFHLLQSRQGMFTQVEWTLYLRRLPLAQASIEQVPLVALYGPLNP